MPSDPLSNSSGVAPHARIMIVDDEPVVVKVLALHLKKAGFTDLVTTTESNQTLTMIRKCQPSLVLLDINMPGVSGLEILTAMQGDKELAPLPVVIITGACDAETLLRATSLGAKDVLQKPIDGQELVERVRAVLA